MRKIILSVFIALLINGCNNKPANNPVSESIADSVSAPIDTAAFLALFTDLKNGPVLLTTESDSVSLNPFLYGKSIPRAYTVLFSQYNTNDRDYSYFEPNSDSTYAYALGKLDMGRYTALIIRHPGMYSSTCVTVFFYDKVHGGLHPSRYWIAESWGDAGDYLWFNTLIERVNDTTLSMVMDKHENTPDETDTTGYRYINFDSTIVYQLVNTQMNFVSGVENKRWTDEPMKQIDNEENE